MKFQDLFRRRKRKIFILIIFMELIGICLSVESDCPWYGRNNVSVGIRTQCICAKSLSGANHLSVQCQDVEGPQLIQLLLDTKKDQEPLELLYLNSSTVTDGNGNLPKDFLKQLKFISLQLSGCGIHSIDEEVFKGQETTLKHLSLSGNQLTAVPKQALLKLSQLSLLDLGSNKITKIEAGEFETLGSLTTLKLNDNALELHQYAFNGLHNSLRNLNLKGTRLSSIPEAIKNLSSIAFLDLAQNRIREVESGDFFGLSSLTALNLERNLLQTLPPSAFNGVKRSLSSLSLLNNLITHFPREAIISLVQLRVLDLGFNLLTEIPSDAFKDMDSLTLLALDGNPLATLAESSFNPLKESLRGLSIGGRFLSCDCRIKWILDWVRDSDLQVTSRERNPQFCGTPTTLRNTNFYQLTENDLVCEKPEEKKISSSTARDLDDSSLLSLNSNIFLPGVEPPTPAHHIVHTEVEDDSEETQENSNQQEPQPTENKKLTAAVLHVESENESESSSNEQVDNENSPSNHVPLRDLRNGAGKSNKLNTNISNLKPPSSSPPTPTTTKKFFRPLKSREELLHNLRPKITSSITVSSTTSSSSSSNGGNKPQRIANLNVEAGRILNKSFVRNNENVGSGQIRRPSPVVFEGGNFDESNIPVITGVGPPLRPPTGSSSVIPNSGSVIPVRNIPITTSTTQTTTSSTTPIPIESTRRSQTFIVQTGPSSTQPTRDRVGNLVFATEKPSEIIMIKDIERRGDSLTVVWETEKNLVGGYRIIYRMFGETAFRHGPPLAASEREYRIKNLPNNACVVVCVVPYEDVLYNEYSVSSGMPTGSGAECRELKGDGPTAFMSQMDKVTIGASAAICLTVLLAAILFITLTRRTKKLPRHSQIIAKVPPGSLIPPSPCQATLHMTGPSSVVKEWDAMSVVSARSIPRARVYHHAHATLDHLAHTASRKNLIPQRTVPDGHSSTHTQRSYLTPHHGMHSHSMHSLHSFGRESSAVTNYLSNQSRLLRASVGSRSSQDALNKHLGPSTQLHTHFEAQAAKRRRMRHGDSLNTLSGYDTPDNWTDHDMDVYVARNATRHDLVQL